MKEIKTAKYKKLQKMAEFYPGKGTRVEKRSDDYVYIVADSFGGADVYVSRENRDKYSVRYGLTDNIFIDSFDSLEEAKDMFPEADIRNDKIRADDMSHSVPDWFDPMNAGERWDDDY